MTPIAIRWSGAESGPRGRDQEGRGLAWLGEGPGDADPVRQREARFHASRSTGPPPRVSPARPKP